MILAPILALSAFAPLARAQQAVNGTYVTGLVSVLQTAGLNQLAGAAQAAMSTPGGQILLSQISQGQKTIFAPNDQAFSGVPSSVTGNQTLVGSILTYHLLSGHFPAQSIATMPNHTLARTYLSDPGLVQLEGNKTQVVAFAVDPSIQRTKILNQNTNVTITNTLTYENLLVHVVDAVIDIPGNFTNAAQAHNLNRVGALISQVNLDEAVQNAKGITIFAPRDAAFTPQIETAVGQLNQTQIATILANHVINGTSVYSTILTQGSYTSAAGTAFTFAFNSSGVFVTSGSSTAKVVESDILIENGVIHIIDGVLVNNASNPQAASSAYQGYTSSAAAAVNQTGAGLGPTPTETGAVGGTSVPPSSGAVPLAVAGGVKQFAVMFAVVLAGAALVL